MDEAQQENQRYRLGKCIMKIHEAVCLPIVCSSAKAMAQQGLCVVHDCTVSYGS